MAIQPLNNDQVPVNLTRTAPVGQTVDVQNGMKNRNAAGDSVAFVASGGANQEFVRIDSTKEAIASAAGAIHAAGKVMNAISDNIAKMKETLEAIVKNYPPFPPGSDERLKLLRSYSSLRKQIDALTVPPLPPDGTEYAKIVGDPAAGESGGIKVTTEKGDVVMINAQEVHAGPGGLDLPELPAMPERDATDDEIYHALGKLDVAVTTLGIKQSGLAADARRLLA
ncbi:hypothetical protein [Geotalea sp. SG265]|uniref:hypothetical protein n=1 Tax=Geotalea sp. SG265 TaxID=2922867 RepID=UPI001FAEEBC7|nr:hypothetical protein [Geotalea sp. SG265]